MTEWMDNKLTLEFRHVDGTLHSASFETGSISLNGTDLINFIKGAFIAFGYAPESVEDYFERG